MGLQLHVFLVFGLIFAKASFALFHSLPDLFNLFMDDLSRAVAQFLPNWGGGADMNGVHPPEPPENSGLGLIPGAQSEGMGIAGLESLSFRVLARGTSGRPSGILSSSSRPTSGEEETRVRTDPPYKKTLCFPSLLILLGLDFSAMIFPVVHIGAIAISFIRCYDVPYSNSGDSRRSLALFTSEWYYWTDLWFEDPLVKGKGRS
ncbi:hypothetical protein K2173_010140 (mitochondrion) [Erythroxylum novogranatense]|uniref:Uncharacterized protein n=1 Tax=Erythroxylum novogranatense TaxID=1862640 RepID=A0AAV8S460_9ROSI|nr:hypothetical protein K2173_010140 [Erythroxylum novogranatense]